MGQLRPAEAAAERAARHGVAVADLATAQLVDEAVRAQYRGPAWEELRARLWNRALVHLTTSIVSGSIYRRCEQLGRPMRRSTILEQPALAQEIAAKVVSETVLSLREEILEPGAWDPARGTLEAFFITCCVARVPNAYRKARRVWNGEAADIDALERYLASPRPTPEAEAVTNDAITSAITGIPKAKDRKAMVMHILGWSYEEIADALVISTGAVAVRMSRARRAIRASKEGVQ